jgi:hypothetical protein
LPTVNFAERGTGRIYARMDSGRLSWTDAKGLEEAKKDPETRAGLLAVAPEAITGAGQSGGDSASAPGFLEAAGFHTLGRWGG